MRYIIVLIIMLTVQRGMYHSHFVAEGLLFRDIKYFLHGNILISGRAWVGLRILSSKDLSAVQQAL